jgi:hypothetical protein
MPDEHCLHGERLLPRFLADVGGGIITTMGRTPQALSIALNLLE